MTRDERARTMSISDRVRWIVAEELGLQDNALASDASIVDDFGADSHDRQQLQLALEVEFDMEIPDGDGQELLTCRQIEQYIERRLAATT